MVQSELMALGIPLPLFVPWHWSFVVNSVTYSGFKNLVLGTNTPTKKTWSTSLLNIGQPTGFTPPAIPPFFFDQAVIFVILTANLVGSVWDIWAVNSIFGQNPTSWVFGNMEYDLTSTGVSPIPYGSYFRGNAHGNDTGGTPPVYGMPSTPPISALNPVIVP